MSHWCCRKCWLVPYKPQFHFTFTSRKNERRVRAQRTRSPWRGEATPLPLRPIRPHLRNKSLSGRQFCFCLNCAILPDAHEISVNLNKHFLPSHTTTTWPSPQHRQEHSKCEYHNNCGHISSCSCLKGVLTDIDKKKTVRRRKWRQKTRRRTSAECFR